MSDQIKINSKINITNTNIKSRNKDNNNLQKNTTDLKELKNLKNQKDIKRLINISSINYSSNLFKIEEKNFDDFDLDKIKGLNNSIIDNKDKDKDDIKEIYNELNSCFIDEKIPISNFI
jgi:hypothetical protein